MLEINSITVETVHECLADTIFLKKRIIKDKVPMRKRGVAGYSIECYRWYGQSVFWAIIDAHWFCETSKGFSNIHNAAAWIQQKMKHKKKRGKQ